jgi:hypothetical protein
MAIQKTNNNDTYEISYNLLSKQDTTNYPEINNWSKYMFIYLHGGKEGGRHYESVYFKTYLIYSSPIYIALEVKYIFPAAVIPAGSIE